MQSLPLSTSSSGIINEGTSSANPVNGLVSQVDEIKISNSGSQLAIESNGETSPAASSDTLDNATMVDEQNVEQDDQANSSAPSATGLETDNYSQGDQLMLIKATRSSGRNQYLQMQKKNESARNKVVSALAATVSKRILPSRARRSSSVKESSKNLKKSSPESNHLMVSVTHSGPARKAAKHQAGTDASSSFNSSG